MSADQEARAIHLVLVAFPGTAAETVRRDVKDQTIRLAAEHGRTKG